MCSIYLHEKDAVKKIAQIAIEDFDSDWMSAPIAHLFTDENRRDLTARVEEETLASIEDEIYKSADGHAAGVPIVNNLTPLPV